MLNTNTKQYNTNTTQYNTNTTQYNTKRLLHWKRRKKKEKEVNLKTHWKAQI